MSQPQTLEPDIHGIVAVEGMVGGVGKDTKKVSKTKRRRSQKNREGVVVMDDRLKGLGVPIVLCSAMPTIPSIRTIQSISPQHIGSNIPTTMYPNISGVVGKELDEQLFGRMMVRASGSKSQSKTKKQRREASNERQTRRRKRR